MPRYSILIDVAKCNGCYNCFLACRDEYHDNEYPGYSAAQPLNGQFWMQVKEIERGAYAKPKISYIPTPCMHCASAPCMDAAKDDAVYRREDGIVIIDPQKSEGQQDIVNACPYGAVWWNPETRIPQKCTFCAHLLDRGWTGPRCVQTCPTGALRLVHTTPERMQKLVDDQGLEIIDKKNSVTQPRIFYRHLFRFNSCFIAGSVVTAVGKKSDCAPGAQVRLYRGSRLVDQQVTDIFGDFKFDGLQKNSGEYRIEISYQAYESQRILVTLGNSRVLDHVCFGRGP